MTVDDVIAAVIQEVENAGEMNNTYFGYSSDQCVPVLQHPSLFCVIASPLPSLPLCHFRSIPSSSSSRSYRS